MTVTKESQEIKGKMASEEEVLKVLHNTKYKSRKEEELVCRFY